MDAIINTIDRTCILGELDFWDIQSLKCASSTLHTVTGKVAEGMLIESVLTGGDYDSLDYYVRTAFTDSGLRHDIHHIEYNGEGMSICDDAGVSVYEVRGLSSSIYDNNQHTGPITMTISRGTETAIYSIWAHSGQCHTAAEYSRRRYVGYKVRVGGPIPLYEMIENVIGVSENRLYTREPLIASAELTAAIAAHAAAWPDVSGEEILQSQGVHELLGREW